VAYGEGYSGTPLKNILKQRIDVAIQRGNALSILGTFPDTSPPLDVSFTSNGSTRLVSPPGSEAGDGLSGVTVQVQAMNMSSGCALSLTSLCSLAY